MACTIPTDVPVLTCCVPIQAGFARTIYEARICGYQGFDVNYTTVLARSSVWKRCVIVVNWTAGPNAGITNTWDCSIIHNFANRNASTSLQAKFTGANLVSSPASVSQTGVTITTSRHYYNFTAPGGHSGSFDANLYDNFNAQDLALQFFNGVPIKPSDFPEPAISGNTKNFSMDSDFSFAEVGPINTPQFEPRAFFKYLYAGIVSGTYIVSPSGIRDVFPFFANGHTIVSSNGGPASLPIAKAFQKIALPANAPSFWKYALGTTASSTPRPATTVSCIAGVADPVIYVEPVYSTAAFTSNVFVWVGGTGAEDCNNFPTNWQTGLRCPCNPFT